MNRILTIGTFLALALSSQASAQSRSRLGTWMGEPLGFHEAVVESESLLLDLRGLPTSEQALVTAIYRIRSPGGNKRFNLTFPADGPAGEVTLKVDGAAVRGGKAGIRDLPADWPTSLNAPSLEGDKPHAYFRPNQGRRNFLFPLLLSPGEHRLEVSFPLKPQISTDLSPNKTFHLAYILTPARQRETPHVELTIHLPAGWLVATEPALDREGDTLKGLFTKELPEAFTLTTRGEVPVVYYDIKEKNDLFWRATIGLGALACVLAGFWDGFRLARNGRALGWSLLLGAMLGLVWTCLLFLSAKYKVIGHLDALPASPREQWTTLVTLWVYRLLSLGAFPAAILLVFLSAWLTWLFTPRPPKPTPPPTDPPAKREFDYDLTPETEPQPRSQTV